MVAGVTAAAAAGATRLTLLRGVGVSRRAAGGLMLRRQHLQHAQQQQQHPEQRARWAGSSAAGSRTCSSPCRRSPGRQRLCSTVAAAAAPETAPPVAVPADDAPHVSVLLAEVLAAFEGREVRRYVDGTLGAGGHAAAMLAQHPEMHTLVGFDLDPTAHQLAGARLEAAGAVLVPVAVSAAGAASCAPPAQHAQQTAQQPTAYVVRSNFGRMRTVLQQLSLASSSSSENGAAGGGSGGPGVDAILLDLGISSMQVDTADRGFSFLREGPLDMRMDPGASLSAEQLINCWPEAELGRIFREFGEERYWKSIARRIVAAREEEPITTTQQLVRAIGNPGGGGKGGGGSRGGRGGGKGGGDAKYKHPATRVFQAIRIAVNGELQSIAQVLPDAIDCLAPGGRLAVITFHSLEDRIVKWAFRRAAGMAPSDEQLPSYCLPFEEAQPEPSIRILTRRPVAPSEEEQRANVRSRSAKLRVVEKL